MSLHSSLLTPNSVSCLYSKSKIGTVSVGSRVRASASDVPDFLSADWLESRRKRPNGPRLNFSAEEAVQYQLDALKYNDQPRPDYGIEVMYRFAGFDPFERSTYFGPFFDLGQFERFRRIFHHSTYRVLLGHKQRKILSSLFVEELADRYILSRLRKCVYIMESRTDLSSEFGYREVDLRKKKYFNLPWFRVLFETYSSFLLKKSWEVIMISTCSCVFNENYKHLERSNLLNIKSTRFSPGHGRTSQLEWVNPPQGCYKVNVDAAINVSNQKAGLGVVIRNSMGKVVAAAVQGAPYRGDVACMEAEAVLFGIQSAQQAAVFPIIIESDSKEVVELSLKKKISKAEIEWPITEIQANLENQNLSSLSYVPRSCNSIAHSIAKIALGFESQVFWLENFPEQIRCTLAKFIN